MPNMYQQKRTAKPIERRTEVKSNGKVNRVVIDGKDIIIPSISYVEALQQELKQLKYINEELKARMAQLETKIGNKISQIESKLR